MDNTSLFFSVVAFWALLSVVCWFWWQYSKNSVASKRKEAEEEAQESRRFLESEGWETDPVDLSVQLFRLESKHKTVLLERKILAWIVLILFVQLVMQNTFHINLLGYFSCPNRSVVGIDDGCTYDY